LLAVSGSFALIRVHSYACSPHAGGFLDYVRFLSFGLISPHLLYAVNRPVLASPVPWRRQLLRVSLAISLIVLTRNAVIRLHAWSWSEGAWLLNHLILACAVALFMTAFGQCVTVFWEMTGSSNKVLINNIFLSPTPAEFWRRWSWPMHLWLYRHVYVPAGGRAHHIRATLLVFLISGLLHEFMAALALGRVTGHQMLFFLLSGFGVLASPALERLGRQGWVLQTMTRFMTITFLVASSSLMFATFQYVLPMPLYDKDFWLLW
jgi:hypothetical protein